MIETSAPAAPCRRLRVLAGGEYYFSEAAHLSADGTVVVGASALTNGIEAFPYCPTGLKLFLPRFVGSILSLEDSELSYISQDPELAGLVELACDTNEPLPLESFDDLVV